MRARFFARPWGRPRPLLVCLALALAVHLVVGASAQLWLKRAKRASVSPRAPLRLLDRQATKAAIDKARAKQRRHEPPLESGRLVSLPPPAKPERNERAPLMAADAHRVDKETISKERELSDKEAALRRQEAQTSASRQALPTAVPDTEAPANKHEAAKGAKTRRARPMTKASGAPTPKAPVGQASAEPSVQAPRRTLGLSDLLPSVAQLARRAGAPVADVSTDDAPEGDVTALNTRSFRFAGFFDRVSQRLRPHWHIYEALAAVRRRGQTLMEHEAYRTTVHVVLDERGQLVSVGVRDPSGVSEFDSAGKGAVEEAAPYLHPPTGLLDENHQVTFDFEFRVSVEPGNLLEGLGWRQDLP